MGEIVIFSKAACPHCLEAKSILKGLEIPYTEIDIGADLRGGMLMSKITNRHTVPQIFFQDRHIGGASDLKALGTEAIRAEAEIALDAPGKPEFLSRSYSDEDLHGAVIPIKTILDPYIPEDPTQIPEYAPVITWYSGMFGFASNFYDQMILKPEPTALWMASLSALMIPMERKIGSQFGTICLVTSMKAGCAYCSAHGAGLAMMHGGESAERISALVDYLKADDTPLGTLPFSGRDQAIINLAARMTTHDATVADIQRLHEEFDTCELRDACTSVAAMGGIMGFLTRFNDLLGTEIEASIKQAIDSSVIGDNWDWGTHDTEDQTNRYDCADKTSRNGNQDQPSELSVAVRDINSRVIEQVNPIFEKYQQFSDDQLPRWIANLPDTDTTRSISCLYHSLFNDGEIESETKHLAAYALALGSGYPHIAAEEKRIALVVADNTASIEKKLAHVENLTAASTLGDLSAFSSKEALALRLTKCCENFPHIVRGSLVQNLADGLSAAEIVELIMCLAVIGIGQRWVAVLEPLNEYTLGHQ